MNRHPRIPISEPAKQALADIAGEPLAGSPPQHTVTRARPALRLSPRPQEFVHRIDRSDDANAALVEVLAALKLSSSCVT